MPRSSSERAQTYRERKKAAGLRRIELWLPDIDSPEFIAEALRQSRLATESPNEEDDQAFIDSISWPR